jgi:hypothetical protein
MRFISSILRASIFSFAFSLLAFDALRAHAQILGYEGPTGVFVTPLASTAPSPANGVGRPVIAAHVLAGGPVIGTFTTFSVTEGLARRFEVGYTREEHAAGSTAGLSPLWRDGFNIFHGKANLVPENAGKTKWVPAISSGGILRTNDSLVFDGSNGQTRINADLYIVATKVVTQAGFPLGAGRECT